jgi:hypothetical protein
LNAPSVGRSIYFSCGGEKLENASTNAPMSIEPQPRASSDDVVREQIDHGASRVRIMATTPDAPSPISPDGMSRLSRATADESVRRTARAGARGDARSPRHAGRADAIQRVESSLPEPVPEPVLPEPSLPEP